MSVGFFTPIHYLNEGGSFLQRAADDYFTFGCNVNRAYVVGRKNDVYTVEIVNCKSSLFSLAIKTFSLFTLVIPAIMLFIKAIYRWNKQFVVQAAKVANPSVVLHLRQGGHGINRAEMDKKYEALFQKIGLKYADATPLQKHSAFFADENGWITRHSIRTGFERLGMGCIQSCLASFVVFKGLVKTGDKVSLRDIAENKHKSDTGSFDDKGAFDLKSFAHLQAFAKTDKTFLTTDELADMRSKNCSRDKHLAGSTFGALASKGEFDLLLSLFGDRCIVDEYGKTTGAITFDRLRAMYLSGPMLFEEIAS